MASGTMPAAAAVLTGDLIGSTKAAPDGSGNARWPCSPRQRAEALRLDPSRRDPRFTRFRGDGWQMLVADPGLALRAALFLTARLRAADLDLGHPHRHRHRRHRQPRQSRASPTPAARPSKPPAAPSTTWAAPAGSPSRATGSPASTGSSSSFSTSCASHWTRQQAEATALYLHPDNPTLEQIAPQLGISAQAVNYRLSGAGAPAIRRALRAWEDAFAQGREHRERRMTDASRFRPPHA